MVPLGSLEVKFELIWHLFYVAQTNNVEETRNDSKSENSMTSSRHVNFVYQKWKIKLKNHSHIQNHKTRAPFPVRVNLARLLKPDLIALFLFSCFLLTTASFFKRKIQTKPTFTYSFLKCKSWEHESLGLVLGHLFSALQKFIVHSPSAIKIQTKQTVL